MNVFKTRLEDYFRLCFWGWNQVSQKSFPNPNQVVFVPKPNQAQQKKKPYNIMCFPLYQDSRCVH